MIKIVLVVALAIAGASAQNIINNGEIAGPPEPYAYRYETETHAASEEKDPSGRVQGFYMLADADGRQRRVDYFADEAGFHAKVQTNEVGTKSENSADVEVLASPPTQEQLIQQAAPVQRQQIIQQAPIAQRAIAQPAIAQGAYRSSSYLYQPAAASGGAYYGSSAYRYNAPAGYGYNGYNGYTTGYGYNGAYNGLNGYNGLNRYNGAYYSGIYNNGAYNNGAIGYTTGYRGDAYIADGISGSYNYHTPGQYFSQYRGGNSYGYGYNGGLAGRYVASGPVRSIATSTVAPPALAGSQNYIVLKKKREAVPAAQK